MSSKIVNFFTLCLFYLRFGLSTSLLVDLARGLCERSVLWSGPISLNSAINKIVPTRILWSLLTSIRLGCLHPDMIYFQEIQTVYVMSLWNHTFTNRVSTSMLMVAGWVCGPTRHAMFLKYVYFMYDFSVKLWLWFWFAMAYLQNVILPWYHTYQIDFGIFVRSVTFARYTSKISLCPGMP